MISTGCVRVHVLLTVAKSRSKHYVDTGERPQNSVRGDRRDADFTEHPDMTRFGALLSFRSEATSS
jgi:hypothetical protein